MAGKTFETQLGLLAALEPQTFSLALVKVTLVELSNASQPKSTLDPSTEATLGRIGIGLAKNLSVITTKAILQQIAVESLEEATAAGLMRDIPKYASREVERGRRTTDVALDVVPLAFKAIVLQHVSFFLVYEAFDIGAYLLSSPKADRRSQERQRASLRKASIRHAVVCVSSIAVGSVGYALGTLIRPGIGTTIVGAVFESVMYLIV